MVTRQPEIIHRLRGILSSMDADVYYLNGSALQALREKDAADLDLIILDGSNETLSSLGKIEEILVEESSPSLLLVVSPEALDKLHLPTRLLSDFVTISALDSEYQVRLHRLLWPGEEAGSSDFIRVGSMTLNLATYQVKVDGVVLDLTYLEYALLAFLVTHPGRTYSRDALLHRVWGFEYFGGSRTVDVHVRRVRSKLGPELAPYLETVRGVGYLWNG